MSRSSATSWLLRVDVQIAVAIAVDLPGVPTQDPLLLELEAFCRDVAGAAVFLAQVVPTAVASAP